MYQIWFYVPKNHLEQVKQAMFAAGAGQVGNYSCCSWQTLGVGQFMPLGGSAAFIGEAFQVSKIAEYQVAMICADDYIAAAIHALKTVHPYEEVPYQVVKIVDPQTILG